MVDVLYIPVQKLNNETCGNCSKKREGRMMEGESNEEKSRHQ
jgi:hypothetical protein